MGSIRADETSAGAVAVSDFAIQDRLPGKDRDSHFPFHKTCHSHQDMGSIRADGSDKFYGMENVSLGLSPGVCLGSQRQDGVAVTSVSILDKRGGGCG
jgi:hypothetical protein